MKTRTIASLALLGGLMLATGCHRPYYAHRYAAHNRPGTYWTGVGLAHAGNHVLASAAHQKNPVAGATALAVGAGLHLAAAGCVHHAYTAPPRRPVYHAPPPPRYSRHRPYRSHYHYDPYRR